MNKRSLTAAVALAAVLGFGVSLVGHAASHMKPGSGAMMKDGGDKGGGKDGGGKDKMKSGAMMKDGGDKGGKDGGKGGKDKMQGGAMMKDGGDKGGKGGKDKMMEGAGGMGGMR